MFLAFLFNNSGMVFRKIVLLFFVTLFIYPPINCLAQPVSETPGKVANDSVFIDSLINQSKQGKNGSAADIKNPEIKDFGSVYNYYLDKAERAYNIGFFKKSADYYRKAAQINPQSLYIKYRLNEIEHFKGKINNVIFFLNFDKPDLLIQSLTYLVIYFIFSMVVILLFILGNRRRMENLEKRKQALLELYQELLVDFLFSEENNEAIITRFRKVIKSHYNRKILIDQMIDLSINLTGDAKDKLRNLYLTLSLDKESISKAFSQRWHLKVKGFQELSFMDITDANDEILRCLHSSNNIVRIEAQLAMVRLNHEDSFGFLDHLEKPFTLWEQLTIYETIMFHNLPIPQFDRWLFSKNKSVVLFSIRMIDLFKQKETYQNLFWMLVNEDSEIRNHVIRVIGNLRIKEALPHLKRLYKTENYANSLAIIQAIAKMPDESVLSFLKLVLDKEDDVQLQIEAAMAISHTGEIGKEALEKLLLSDYKNYQIIIKHVLDKRIN
jgi:tetratricopeptide (TPR) repeat protein